MNHGNRPPLPHAGFVDDRTSPGAPASPAAALARLGHDLRIPLVALLDDLATIEALPPEAAARRRTACTHAAGAVREALQLVEALLDLAETDGDTHADGAVHREDAPLVETGIATEALLRTAIRGLPGTAALVLDLPEHLPRLRIDVARFRPALQALIRDAIDAVRPDGCVAVTARVEWASGDLLILVSDDRAHGPASAAAVRPALAAFHAHGAHLAIRTDPSQGQVATVRIPVTRVTGTEMPESS